jgi:putative membrane protein
MDGKSLSGQGVETSLNRAELSFKLTTIQRYQRSMSLDDLPAINASLNLVSTVFISAGWFWIRRNVWQRHVPCMIGAIISSTLFLIGYVVYHASVGEKSSGYRGLVAAIYFPVLASHVLLAFITLPLVILTLVPVFRRRWDKHRRLGRWTMPIWLYVSVTGVVVYLMLYRWFPPGNLALSR